MVLDQTTKPQTIQFLYKSIKSLVIHLPKIKTIKLPSSLLMNLPIPILLCTFMNYTYIKNILILRILHMASFISSEAKIKQGLIHLLLDINPRKTSQLHIFLKSLKLCVYVLRLQITSQSYGYSKANTMEIAFQAAQNIMRHFQG